MRHSIGAKLIIIGFVLLLLFGMLPYLKPAIIAVNGGTTPIPAQGIWGIDSSVGIGRPTIIQDPPPQVTR
jgi:hypothetical protein